MSKNLSIRERKRRELFKKYHALESKMHGNNVIWWNSLSMDAQYSLLFKWERFKIRKKDKKIKLKHFLLQEKRNYKPKISNYRNAVINHLISE